MAKSCSTFDSSEQLVEIELLKIWTKSAQDHDFQVNSILCVI